MSEQQLRKALGAVNDLEPPRDDLFVERAMTRGRARIHRRRSVLLGAAAGLALVGALGGTWVAGHQGPGATTSASVGAASAPKEASGGAADSGGPPSAASAMPSAGERSDWFRGPMTPVRSAMEALSPSLEARFPDVFAGMYAADAGDTRIVVCVTRTDPTLEGLVSSSAPAGADITYRTVPHSIDTLRAAVRGVDAARTDLAAQGVTVVGTRIDARTNRVVVTTLGPDHGAVGALVGADLVTVVVDTSHTPGQMLPGGSTLPPLQR